ncbi:BRCT domain-containing protein [Anaeromyxobacter soli]|uniref:BRCT domain-containing protein n=1 Tax=Anaeromyxobacter soli TaxID=2922725 RepID=UPI001FB018EB|nr:BRCT domain-containing protein [Anaeromyxobacter sp. SG29]
MNDSDHALKYDSRDFLKFSVRQDRERDVNELEGLIRGIALDGRIVAAEAMALNRWCLRERNRPDGSLFREARDRVREAVSDGMLDDEERADILHFCELLRSPSAFYSVATADMQRLHGLLAGIGADGVVNDVELSGLSEWLENAENLKGTWPYDEIDSVVTHVLADRRIDAQEHEFLVAFTQGFLDSTSDLVLETPFDETLIRFGICASQPEITFQEKRFCITGSSPRASRRQIESVVARLGGIPHPRVVKDLDYLIVAAERSLSWAFSCYGRKVEAAMQLRRNGASLAIVHETDFWDAAADRGIQPPSSLR